jgi:hypothetical protein
MDSGTWQAQGGFSRYNFNGICGFLQVINVTYFRNLFPNNEIAVARVLILANYPRKLFLEAKI